MSGIDIVLHQVMPGMSDYLHTVTCATGVGAASFYEYVLAKLGASLAHLNPAMQGKAMCEVFGAYGWGEDSTMMKFLMDHLLVRGINHFVPHAFSSKFPDGDCPPHFGAEGKDPSFEAFSALMGYVNKASHILEGTIHKANAAVLYHVEGEWASRFGNADNMENIVTRLYDAHIDYDIVSADMLSEWASVKDGKLCINEESFDCLIVPYADHMPNMLLDILQGLQESGVEVWFTRALPENADLSGTVLQYDEIVGKMKGMGMTDVIVPDGFPKLRIYHCKRGESDIFMFANEDYSKVADTVIKLPCTGDYARLDLLNDVCVSGSTCDGSFKLSLQPNQSQIVIFGDKAGLSEEFEIDEGVSIEPSYTLELADCENLKEFAFAGEFDRFFNVNSPNFEPDFSGKMRYTFKFNAEKKNGRIFLDLGKVGQNAQLNLNGCDAGIRICRPYLFEVTDIIKDGENEAVVTVSNTLAQKVRDRFSQFLQLAPSGLLGEIKVRYTK